jgi:hypothetical protein
VRKVDLGPPQALGIPYGCASELPAECTSNVSADDPGSTRHSVVSPPGPQAD